MSILFAGAVIPGIILLVYIFKKDKAEKEPIQLLLKLLGLGALTCFPASVVEGVLYEILYGIFNTTDETAVLLPDGKFLAYHFIGAFFAVALVEEAFKWLAMYIFTRKNKNFNSLFDGIIYAVFTSLGFAILENILYVFSSGIETAIIRAVTAVPGHMFFGVLMGYFYTMWNASKSAAGIEKDFIAKGHVPSGTASFGSGKLIALSMIVPVSAHGLYDFLCFISEKEKIGSISMLLFYAFLVVLYIVCFKTINTMSKKDTGIFNYSILWFLEKHPTLNNDIPAYLNERAAQQMQNPYAYGYNPQQTYAPDQTQNPYANGYDPQPVYAPDQAQNPYTNGYDPQRSYTSGQTQYPSPTAYYPQSDGSSAGENNPRQN